MKDDKSPWASLGLLLVLTVICSVAAQFVVILLGLLTSGSLHAAQQDGVAVAAFTEKPFFMYALLVASSFGTFLLPAIILQLREPFRSYFPTENKGNLGFYVLAVLLLVAFGPVMQWVGALNSEMSLPPGLAGIEAWMRAQEDKMAVLTEQIVMVDHVGLLLSNILVMAVVPAIAEEYYFRGSLMQIIQRLTHNHHITVWLTAVIFSAIHVQFFGFFPRLILGVFFGYMFVWSRNIWVPILGHFVNNATVTVIAFVYTKQGKTFDDLQHNETYSIFVYLGSLIITGALAFYFYKKSKQQQQIIHGERLD
ncbi:CPBP family intramembrane glutamic endopeptidase [Sphingobacterium sp. Mn56C]